RYADYIFGLRKGKLIVEGPPSEVITSPLVKDIFGLDCVVIEDPVSGSPFAVPRGRYHTDHGLTPVL
ncbi:MAG: ABC transporter ATP-binding protein, partial [Planococcus sp. (in: Bacteria)]|nr:ABC transporter ATP-binding protein [Planococcus sp. (in: firmicutes)]